MLSIQNEILCVTISEQGGTLQSIKNLKNGLEYLWQGDKTYWGGRAPNLFPFVGRLFQQSYTLEGKTYPMQIHGFLSKSTLTPAEVTPTSCSLILEDSEQTRLIYPFRFCFRLTYWLEGTVLGICFHVENRSEETMICGFGGHPGFNVPLEEGLSFTDYRLSFPGKCEPRLVEFSPSVLDSGARTPYALEEGSHLPLNHSLFTFDAVVLEGTTGCVELASPKGRHGVRVSYPQMPYVGFWHKPNTDAPFVCIEPWSVLPGREGVVEDLSHMADMTHIAPGASFDNRWSIEVW